MLNEGHALRGCVNCGGWSVHSCGRTCLLCVLCSHRSKTLRMLLPRSGSNFKATQTILYLVWPIVDDLGPTCCWRASFETQGPGQSRHADLGSDPLRIRKRFFLRGRGAAAPPRLFFFREKKSMDWARAFLPVPGLVP